MGDELREDIIDLIHRKRISQKNLVGLQRLSASSYQQMADHVIQGKYDENQILNVIFLMTNAAMSRAEVRSVYISMLLKLICHENIAIRDASAIDLCRLLSFRTIPRWPIEKIHFKMIESALRSVSPSTLGEQTARRVKQLLDSGE